MDCRHSVVVLSIILLNICHRIHGSGCQHQCDCGFQLTNDEVQDDNATLRYEVLGGLCGAFSPILLAGLTYLIYKQCCSPFKSSSLGPTSRGASWDEANSGGNRGQHRPPPIHSSEKRPPRVSTPTSLYGEDENDMAKPVPPPYYSPNQNGTTSSKWMNIHRNVEADQTNVWLKNVVRVKQFY